MGYHLTVLAKGNSYYSYLIERVVSVPIDRKFITMKNKTRSGI